MRTCPTDFTPGREEIGPSGSPSSAWRTTLMASRNSTIRTRHRAKQPPPPRLPARPRGDRPLGQPVERLAHDLDGLAELDHPHAIAREAVAGRLHGDLEVEVLIGRVRLGGPRW